MLHEARISRTDARSDEDEEEEEEGGLQRVANIAVQRPNITPLPKHKKSENRVIGLVK